MKNSYICLMNLTLTLGFKLVIIAFGGGSECPNPEAFFIKTHSERRTPEAHINGEDYSQCASFFMPYE